MFCSNRMSTTRISLSVSPSRSTVIYIPRLSCTSRRLLLLAVLCFPFSRLSCFGPQCCFHFLVSGVCNRRSMASAELTCGRVSVFVRVLDMCGLSSGFLGHSLKTSLKSRGHCSQSGDELRAVCILFNNFHNKNFRTRSSIWIRACELYVASYVWYSNDSCFIGGSVETPKHFPSNVEVEANAI